MPVTRHPTQLVISAFCLAVLTLLVFWRVTTFDFVEFDDGNFVAYNPFIQEGLTWSGLRWAFGASLLWATHNLDYWQPVTVISRLIDVELWGLNPHGHHLTNLVIHLANVLLLLFFLNRLTGSVWKSAWVAAMFSVHPLQVEPVAWISARKDVLSAFWGLLTLLSYMSLTEKPSFKKKIRTAVLMTCAVMSKPVLITLPFLMLLLDFWPLQRLNKRRSSKEKPKWTRLVSEKWPFFLIALVSVLVTFFAGKTSMLSHGLTNLKQMAGWPIGYFVHLSRVVFPLHLIVRSDRLPTPSLWLAFCSLLGHLTLLYFAWRQKEREPYRLFGWFWFLIALTPAAMVAHLTSDHRFVYVPLIGVLVLLAWGVPNLFNRLRLPRPALIFVAAATLVSCAALSYQSLPRWQDTHHLFQHALSVEADNLKAHEILGIAYSRENEWEQATFHAAKTVELQPAFSEGHALLGTILAKQGKYAEAVPLLVSALRLRPDNLLALRNLGGSLVALERSESAVPLYREAIRLAPDDRGGYKNLAKILYQLGRFEEVVETFQSARRVLSPDAPSLTGTADALVRLGREEEAVSYYEEALELDPAFDPAIRNLKVILERKKQ